MASGTSCHVCALVRNARADLVYRAIRDATWTDIHVHRVQVNKDHLRQPKISIARVTVPVFVLLMLRPDRKWRWDNGPNDWKV